MHVLHERNLTFPKNPGHWFPCPRTKKCHPPWYNLWTFTNQAELYFNKINSYIANSLNQDDDDDDDDEVTSSPIDCKYYTLEEYSNAKFDSNKTFSVFHTNIHSFDLHFDELAILLELIDFRFDVLAISEWKIQKNKSTKTDITLDAYHYPLSIPTEATKGCVLLYVHKKQNYKPRPDLIIYNPKQLESCSIEIINANGKILLISIDIHPCAHMISMKTIWNH